MNLLNKFNKYGRKRMLFTLSIVLCLVLILTYSLFGNEPLFMYTFPGPIATIFQLLIKLTFFWIPVVVIANTAYAIFSDRSSGGFLEKFLWLVVIPLTPVVVVTTMLLFIVMAGGY